MTDTSGGGGGGLGGGGYLWGGVGGVENLFFMRGLRLPWPTIKQKTVQLGRRLMKKILLASAATVVIAGVANAQESINAGRNAGLHRPGRIACARHGRRGRIWRWPK